MGKPIKLAGPDIIQRVVKAATGRTTFTQATREIAVDERQSLSRVLRRDVDEWRAEFADQLRSAGTELLEDLRARRAELEPGQIAYALAVVVDKASTLDGRNQLASASVNVQINNFGSAPKDTMLEQLYGKSFAPAASPAPAGVIEAIEVTPAISDGTFPINTGDLAAAAQTRENG